MKPTASERIGDLIAQRYRVEQLLGRGGTAVVYQVHDERMQRRVALKRCFARDRLTLVRHGLRLEREYHTLAQLAHPHIIDVYDYSIAGEVPYYTMELLSGSDLANVERLPWEPLCLVMHDVASALALLHSRGLLHRDVSLRNVHANAEGRAKLIDFGAMMSMGVARDVVGTPPFMAPEVVQLQALDGRADIFSLGALAYRLLTGRHAFPARRFSELRDAWRSRPVPPRALVADIPVELSNLVMRALTLDRATRLRTAADLLEQLRAITTISDKDSAEISRAYLTTPLLVGRDAALLAVRRHILGLVRGDGGLVTIRGVPGSGQSRMLDACALEGKLLGAAVVRADARDAAEGEWGVARAIGRQLIDQFPRQAEEAARLSRNVLGQLFEQLRPDELVTVTESTPDRSLIIRELREWVMALAKAQRLLILVDDIEHLDDASLAWLTALAHKAERRALLLILAAVDDTTLPLPPGLQLLSSHRNNVELSDLTDAQTESLLRSLFGDIPNLPLCAARIHGLSHGNPRATMELAQHLVHTRRARYEAGSWQLPDALDEGDLPSSLSDTLLGRLGALSPRARELADALALADEDAISLKDYPSLLGRDDGMHAFAAVDELIALRVLVTGGERSSFTQRGFISVLQENMPQERRELLHTRIALLLIRPDQVLRRAHHLLAAKLDKDALELLCRIDLSTHIPPASLLVAAIERAEALELPASALHRLRMGLLLAAPRAMNHTAFRRVAPVVLAQLERDSGLAHYRALSHLPESERLVQAMGQAQQTYAQTPEHQRVHTVIEAIRELARMSGAIMNMALPMLDPEPLDGLPDLSPLYPLSPGLRVIGDFVEAAKAWVRGRVHRSRELMLVVLARLEEPDRAGFDDAQYERVRLGTHWMLGLFEAAHGIESAERHAEQLERKRETRVNAYRVRALLQLAIGDASEARRCQRRAELLQGQEGLKQVYVSSTSGMDVLLRSVLGDLLGIKSQLPRLALLAAQYPAWRAVELLGRCRYAMLQGDLLGALEFAHAGLLEAKPGQQAFYSAFAFSHIGLLSQLGRVAEASALGKHYLQVCREHDLSAPDVPLAAAEAMAQAGEHAEAVRVLEPLLEQSQRLGRVGLAAGRIHESFARVAAFAGDWTAFERHLEHCALEYEKAHNPALGSRVTALIEHARERGMTSSQAGQRLQSRVPAAQDSEPDTLHSRIEECVDRADRARCSLTLLLQNAASSLGYLYVFQDNRSLELLAALPDAPFERGLTNWVQRQAQLWLDRSERTVTEHGALDSQIHTQTETDEGSTATGSEADEHDEHYSDSDGRRLEGLWLVHGDFPNDVLVGFLVVENIAAQQGYVPVSTRAAIARELMAYGDAKGWRREA